MSERVDFFPAGNPVTSVFGTINAICDLATELANEKDLLEGSLKQILLLFGAQRGSIFICKEEGSDDLVLGAAFGMAASDQRAMVKRLGEGVVGHVAALKQPIAVEDIASDERFKNYKARKSYKTPSFICAPLLIKDRLLGVINLADKESGTHFSKDELQLLDLMASQIALNFQRLKLHEKFQKIVKESETLRSELGRTSQETDFLKKQVLAQERLASIGKLAGGIAHEFNNPLDGVMRYSNLCLEHLGEDEIVRNYLLEIKHGLSRMAGIVKSLLACSRSPLLASQNIDVNGAVELALQDQYAEVLLKNAKVVKSLARDLPLIPDLGLERIVSNLIRNAIDAIDSKGVIKIKTSFKAETIFLEIKDNGCGISEENIQHIFEPFYTTKDISRGCGLGLTIVGEVVKSYNGKIHVQSKPGKETTFAVEIPTAG